MQKKKKEIWIQLLRGLKGKYVRERRRVRLRVESPSAGRTSRSGFSLGWTWARGGEGREERASLRVREPRAGQVGLSGLSPDGGGHWMNSRLDQAAYCRTGHHGNSSAPPPPPLWEETVRPTVLAAPSSEPSYLPLLFAAGRFRIFSSLARVRAKGVRETIGDTREERRPLAGRSYVVVLPPPSCRVSSRFSSSQSRKRTASCIFDKHPAAALATFHLSTGTRVEHGGSGILKTYVRMGARRVSMETSDAVREPSSGLVYICRGICNDCNRRRRRTGTVLQIVNCGRNSCTQLFVASDVISSWFRYFLSYVSSFISKFAILRFHLQYKVM